MVFKLNSQLLSRIASGNGHGEDSPYFDGWKAYETDPHHPTENPNGVIQMGLAENQLCFDLIQDWLKKNPKASICTPEGLNEFREIAIFQDYHGLPEFRNAVANFMGKVRGNRVTYDPDRIVMSGGATGAHETIAFCLADPGEAFLVPTPYYPGFDRDLRWRTGVKLIPVDSDSSNNFKVTIEALENAYEMAQLDNIKVKGLLITNPSNPLGTILDRETLRSIVRFINEKNIHLVCDEIYAATVFSQPDFISVAEILQEDIECNLDLVHVVYSLSKDMGFPGLRVGIIYSYNDAVVSCARKMSSFGLVSTQTQYLVASMLSDNEFVEKFITGKQKEISRKTVEAEMELWRVIIHEVKLNVSPGCSFHCLKPGWFRVCFANMDDQTMHVALSRIKTFVNKEADTKKKPKKSLRWQGSLKLLNPPRIYDDFINSPHSPMPHSPLVRARN
ncbi:hypothetical protein OIU84_022191 [Salix udensis]|uniref:1-aminocyclopropane-1-carboxylate synthase n=1 Tax=Salix udensis TaxID=889485 RepID=A0AAD6KN75_9ROSI|nr:hypothetical protein OIU84_022191 [Salix udensis]